MVTPWTPGRRRRADHLRLKLDVQGGLLLRAILTTDLPVQAKTADLINVRSIA